MTLVHHIFLYGRSGLLSYKKTGPPPKTPRSSGRDSGNQRTGSGSLQDYSPWTMSNTESGPREGERESPRAVDHTNLINGPYSVRVKPKTGLPSRGPRSRVIGQTPNKPRVLRKGGNDKPVKVTRQPWVKRPTQSGNNTTIFLYGQRSSLPSNDTCHPTQRDSFLPVSWPR